MKKILILMVLGMVLMACQSFAYSVATASGGQNTTTMMSYAGTLERITVCNSCATSCTVDLFDSGTYFGSVVMPPKETYSFRLGIRIANHLKVYTDDSHTFVCVEYSGGVSGSSVSGHYPYGVKNSAVMNTPCATGGDVIGVLVANFNTDTGYTVTFSDSHTAKIKVCVPAKDTRFISLDRFRFNTSFQITMERLGMAAMIIRREE